MTRLRNNGGYNKEKQKELGQLIEDYREAQGTSLIQLAQKTGISSTHMARIEQGLNRPSRETLAKIQQQLHITDNALFTCIGEEEILPLNTDTSAISTLSGNSSAPRADLSPEIVHVKEAIGPGVISKLIWESENKISIMAHWFGDDLFRLQKPFAEAIGRGASIRFLFCHPTLAEERASSIITGDKASKTTMPSQNIQTLSEWFTYWNNNGWKELQEERIKEREEKGLRDQLLADWKPERFRLRISEQLFPFQFFRFDDTGMVGFFSKLQKCRTGPQLQARLHQIDEKGSNVRTILGRALLDEFAVLWNESIEFTLSGELSQIKTMFPKIDYVPLTKEQIAAMPTTSAHQRKMKIQMMTKHTQK